MQRGSTSTPSSESAYGHAPGETLNLLTHGLGLILTLLALDRMVVALQGCTSDLRMAGAIVYVVTLVGVYAASTLSHSFRDPRLRNLFRTVDQVCIFFLIAGTYTPWGLTFNGEGWGWVLLCGMWALAFVGAAFKLLVTGRENVSVAFYVILGWLPVLAVTEIVPKVPVAALAWMVAGGLCYTSGTYFLLRDERRPYFHAIWHLLVIAGSACHFLAILWYVVPYC
jgi:hemolysin III